MSECAMQYVFTSAACATRFVIVIIKQFILLLLLLILLFSQRSVGCQSGTWHET